jgi:hypothetical protein
MREIRQGQFYRHFKDKLYQVLAIAEHSETGEKMVVYQALYGDYKVYVRPYEMFASEVDHEKYPDVKQRYRFEQTEPTSDKKDSKSKAEPEEDQVNPILLEFLDADTLEEKMHVLAFYRNKVDENLLNSIAISLDLVVEKKGVQNQYDEIMNCLSMMKKFECNRFR